MTWFSAFTCHSCSNILHLNYDLYVKILQKIVPFRKFYFAHKVLYGLKTRVYMGNSVFVWYGFLQWEFYVKKLYCVNNICKKAWLQMIREKAEYFALNSCFVALSDIKIQTVHSLNMVWIQMVLIGWQLFGTFLFPAKWKL